MVLEALFLGVSFAAYRVYLVAYTLRQVKAFNEGIKAALAEAVEEQGLLEMMTEVVESWIENFKADLKLRKLTVVFFQRARAKSNLILETDMLSGSFTVLH